MGIEPRGHGWNRAVVATAEALLVLLLLVSRAAAAVAEMFEWLRAQNALLTVADVQSRTIPTLRLELRARRLDCQGKRAELLERLEQAIRMASSS